MYGELKVWDTSTGKLKLERIGAGDGGGWVQFSRDGKLIALSQNRPPFGGNSREPAVTIWEVEGGKRLRVLSGFESVSDIAFSADGKSLAALTDPRFGQRLDITVWNPTTGRKELSIAVGGDGFPLVFGPLAFSPGGKLLAYSYSNHFGYRTGKVEFRVTGKLKANRRVELGSEVCAMSWKQKGAVLACGCWDGTINLLDAESAKITQTLKGHTEPVRALAFSDSGTLVSADAKGGVRMSELKSGKQVIRHEPPKGNVRCVALTEDGKLVAFGLEGGEIIVSEIPRSEKDVRKK